MVGFSKQPAKLQAFLGACFRRCPHIGYDQSCTPRFVGMPAIFDSLVSCQIGSPSNLTASCRGLVVGCS